MVVQNCGWCLDGPEADVTEVSCRCKKGYMNKEGTFILGEWVSSGRALSKNDYEKHQRCKTCDYRASPHLCKWRQEHLSPSTQQESPKEDGPVHFFVPSKDIDPEVLKAFVKENGGEKGESAADKLFKDEKGFIVTAQFRFNSQDIVQLQELSERRRQGLSMTTESFARKSRSVHRLLNEFTHFVQGTTGREPEVRPPPLQLLNLVQSDPDRSERTVSNTTHRKSQSDNSRQEIKDSVPELTSAVRRVSVSDRSRDDILASGIYTRRHDQDDASSDSTYQHRNRPYPEEPATGAQHRQSHAPQGDLSVPAPVQQQPSETPARDISEGQDSDATESRTTHSNTVSREPLYNDTHSTPADQQKERHDSYVSPVAAPTHQQANRQPIREESEPKDSDAAGNKGKQSEYSRHDARRSDTLSHATGKQSRGPEKSSKPATKTQAMRKPTGKESDSKTHGEDAADVKLIKFFLPSEGLDLTVLAFYLRLCVDSNATVKHAKNKGEDGFILEAKRAVTIEEIADMKRDTKGWLSEKRGPSSRETYMDSETAKERRKKAGRKR